jgi:hypothetical protein
MVGSSSPELSAGVERVSQKSVATVDPVPREATLGGGPSIMKIDLP